MFIQQAWEFGSRYGPAYQQHYMNRSEILLLENHDFRQLLKVKSIKIFCRETIQENIKSLPCVFDFVVGYTAYKLLPEITDTPRLSLSKIHPFSFGV